MQNQKAAMTAGWAEKYRNAVGKPVFHEVSHARSHRNTAGEKIRKTYRKTAAGRRIAVWRGDSFLILSEVKR